MTGNICRIEYHSDNSGENDDYVTGYFEIDKRVYNYGSSICLLTFCFRVYEVKEKERKVEQIGEMKSLDGQALFPGHSHSQLIVTSDFPGSESNQMYYMDDCPDRIKGPYQPYGPIEVGVYSLEDQCTTPLYVAILLMKRVPPPHQYGSSRSRILFWPAPAAFEVLLTFCRT